MPDLDMKISLHETINSGQILLWENYGNEWFVLDGNDIIMGKQTPFEVITFSKIAKNFFREDDNYEKILKDITKDKIVKKATNRYPGLRITRQDPFQCCISFIVSSNSNIPNIRMRLQKLCRKFGKKVRFQKRDFVLFPEPKRLARATLQELKECKLGYRSKYVLDTSQAIASGEVDLDELKKMKYEQVREVLLKLPGIGDKVADCVMLFSLEKLDSFPLDTWMLKILQKYYSNNICIDKKSISKKRYEDIHQNVLEHFGKYAGYSQQFLYKMERDLNEKRWL